MRVGLIAIGGKVRETCIMGTARKFGIVQGGRRPAGFENEDVSVDDVWPEVSSRYSEAESAQAVRENSSRRVFFEAFLILVVAGLIAALMTQWAPILS